MILLSPRFIKQKYGAGCLKSTSTRLKYLNSQAINLQHIFN